MDSVFETFTGIFFSRSARAMRSRDLFFLVMMAISSGGTHEASFLSISETIADTSKSSFEYLFRYTSPSPLRAAMNFLVPHGNIFSISDSLGLITVRLSVIMDSYER